MIKAMWDYVHVRYLNQKGQGMVEYALILVFVVGIAAVLASSDSGIKGGLEAAFKTVSDALKENPAAPAGS